jgi:hypothetical protein
LEIATYTAIEDLASALDDAKTVRLAASIRADEEHMFDRLIGELPKLTEAVAASDVRGESQFDLSTTGAADAARAAGRELKSTARRASSDARKGARQARKVPGVARAEGEIKGALASAGDLPIANYDDLTASEIVGRLAGLSQIDIAKIDAYERRHEKRTTVLSRITSLRKQEPWPGYDELDVSEVRAVLDSADDERVQRVASYERSHKHRTGVLEAAEHELSRA